MKAKGLTVKHVTSAIVIIWIAAGLLALILWGRGWETWRIALAHFSVFSVAYTILFYFLAERRTATRLGPMFAAMHTSLFVPAIIEKGNHAGSSLTTYTPFVIMLLTRLMIRDIEARVREEEDATLEAAES